MQCPGCHKSIADDSKFCQYCGVPIGSSTPAKAPTTTAPTPAAPAPETQRVGSPIDPATEKPVREFRPAWRSSLPLWVVWLLGTIVLFYLRFHFEVGDVWKQVIWVLVLLAAFAVFVRQAVNVLSIRYRLTTQRLFIERGLLTRTTDQMELIRVDDVRVRQGLIDRLVNIGDVEVISSDVTDKQTWLHGVDAPTAIAEDVRVNSRRARSQRTLYVDNV